MLVIASFPRSGNHLVRFFVEYLTGRPTLGCPGNPKDVPIHLNNFPDQPDVLAHVGGAPIGIKAHWPEEIQKIGAITGIIFIRRQPDEAILAYLLKPETSHRAIYKYAKRYIALRRCVERMPQPKITLFYERLLNPADGIREIERLAEFLGTSADPERTRLLKEDFERLSAVNATATDRSWNGINSEFDKHFYSKHASWLNVMAANVAVKSASLLH